MVQSLVLMIIDNESFILPILRLISGFPVNLENSSSTNLGSPDSSLLYETLKDSLYPVSFIECDPLSFRPEV